MDPRNEFLPKEKPVLLNCEPRVCGILDGPMDCVLITFCPFVPETNLKMGLEWETLLGCGLSASLNQQTS